MNGKQRRISLLHFVRTRLRVTAEELARELGCTERTVYRDIAELQAYGLPIEGKPGHDGGYVWQGNSP